MLENYSLSAANIVQVLFVFLGIFGSILINHLQRFKGAQYLLICFSTLMLFNLLEELDISKSTVFITPAFTLLIGPVIYLMTLRVVNAEKKQFTGLLLHAIPALLSVFFTHHTSTIIALGSLSQLGYLYFSYQLFTRYDNALANSQTDIGTSELHWLKLSILLLASFFIIDMLRLNIRPFINERLYYNWYLIDLIVLFLICCIIVLKAIRQHELFNDLLTYEENKPETQTKSVASHSVVNSSVVNGSVINDADIRINDKELAEKILRTIDKELNATQLYKAHKLSIQQVADKLGLQSKDVSWAINLAAKQNFNDYINCLRIQEVKRQLILSRAANIKFIDVAIDCGFNSKSTFYLAFKKFEGKTPSQFIEEN